MIRALSGGMMGPLAETNLAQMLQSDGLPWALVALGFAVSAFLFMRGRQQAQIVETVKAQLGETEWRLNEAESALQAESQILIAWSAGATEPERMVGSLHGTAKVPSVLAEIISFSTWLERDSAAVLSQSLAALRGTGAPFNFGVKTKSGDLLEADGRAAGTMTTLRFRPLAGQRLELSETQHDAHKLAKQVERLSGLLDAAPFPVWLMAQDGSLVWINRAYVAAVDATGADDVLRNNRKLVKPEAFDRSKADPARHLIGRTRAARGGDKPAFNVFEIPQGEQAFCFAVNVSGQEEAERELERHVSAQISMLNKLSTAIAVFGPDQRLSYSNQAYGLLWELEEKFLATRPTDGEIMDRLRSRRLLPEQANYKEWRARQLAAYSKTETREDYWYLPDGRSLRVVAEPHPLGGLTYLYDNLTKEHQLERGLNEMNEVQRETLDNLAEAVALYGPDGRLKLFNPAFARFWPMSSAMLERQPHVKEMADLAGLSASSSAAWADIKFNITGLEANRKQLEGRIEQGERELRYRSVPLPDGSALVTFSDISDAARAERALQERAEALETADQLKNRILTNVSYEVRTPLNSIIGFSEAMAMGVAGKLAEKQADYVNAIRQSSSDLKAIIDAIIDLSALDAGQMDLKLADVDVEELLKRVANRFVDLLQKRELEVSIEVASNVTSIRGDEERLDQILGHLLSNAAGFSPVGTRIRLGARRQGNTIQIWVADNGRGIDPDFQPRVFDRFQSKPSPGSHRGPGLGLALVKGLVELHGGKVSLVSKLDMGTTVVCNFPLNGPARFQRASAA